jgi:hypothetical protein
LPLSWRHLSKWIGEAVSKRYEGSLINRRRNYGEKLESPQRFIDCSRALKEETINQLLLRCLYIALLFHNPGTTAHGQRRERHKSDDAKYLYAGATRLCWLGKRGPALIARPEILACQKDHSDWLRSSNSVSTKRHGTSDRGTKYPIDQFCDNRQAGIRCIA